VELGRESRAICDDAVAHQGTPLALRTVHMIFIQNSLIFPLSQLARDKSGLTPVLLSDKSGLGVPV